MNAAENEEGSRAPSERGGLPLWKKTAYALAAVLLGLVLIEVVAFVLLLVLKPAEGGDVVLANENDPTGRTVSIDHDLAGELGQTMVFNMVQNWTTHPDPKFIFRVRPGSSAEPRLREIGVNSQGFRGREFEAGASGDPKILIVGDSCGFGWGIWNLEDTFAGRLETMLEADGKSPWIFNLSQPGFSSFQCSLMFDEWFDRVEPDILILFLGWNDMNLSFISDEMTSRILGMTMSSPTGIFRKLNSYKVIAELVHRYRVRTLVVQAEMGQERKKRRRVLLEDSLKYFSGMVGHANEAGSKVVIVLPPFSAKRAPDLPRGLRPMVEYREALTEAFGEEALCVDFPETDYPNPESAMRFQEDGYHPNEEGAKVLAEGLHRAISGGAGL